MTNTTLNYDQLLKKAKLVLKRDRAAEKLFVENKLKFKDFNQTYFTPHFTEMLFKIVELTKLGHEILIDKSYRNGAALRIYYKLLPDQLAEAEAQARNEIQAALDAEYKAKLDVIVTELAAEIEAEQQAQLANEAATKSKAVKEAILKLLEQGE